MLREEKVIKIFYARHSHTLHYVIPAKAGIHTKQIRFPIDVGNDVNE